MARQRVLLGWVLAAAATAAAAQTGGALRWRANGTPLGLQAGGDTHLPCSGYTLSCTETTLYASEAAPRSLSMQVSAPDSAATLRFARPPELNVSLVGRAAIASDLGVYGRVGTTLNRAATPAVAALAGGDGGLTYGVGLSWDFSRRASASMGLDSYDIRTSLGDTRELRTSLGLRLRY